MLVTNTDADVWPLLVSERLPRGNSLVPREPSNYTPHTVFLFFAACVQRSLLCYFPLTPVLNRACIAGREERGKRLRRGAGTEPLRAGAQRPQHTLAAAVRQRRLRSLSTR